MCAAPLVEDTVAAGEPAVGEGTGRSAPFMDKAKSDSVANPTLGGSARKTEYTFFYREEDSVSWSVSASTTVATLVGNT